MAIFKKHSLRAGNSRTRAAELTLRESIYPLCLVTILFFLWVRTGLESSAYLQCPSSHENQLTLSLGFLLWAHRYIEQTLPGSPGYHQIAKLWIAGRLLRRISARFTRSRELDSQAFRLQSRLHLGTCSIRHWLAPRMASPCVPLVRILLRCHLHYR